MTMIVAPKVQKPIKAKKPIKADTEGGNSNAKN